MLAEYRTGDPRATRWLGAPAASDPAAFARAFAARGGWDREALAGILADAVGDPAEDVAAAIARLRQRDAVCVVAGQQPAVGGGPLYTLVKAAQAVAIARRLTAGGVAAVPVFWCASEDHDLGEADHADLIGRDGAIERVRVDLGPGRASLRHRPAGPGFAAVVERLRAREPAALGGGFVAGLAPRGDEGLGAWECRLLMRVFAGHGLIAVEAHRLRPLWRPALARALDAWPAARLAALREEVVAAGFADALGDLAAPPLFRDRASGRDALAPDAARAALADGADALSPGAALRPILQQVALPAACAVLGPGELAYHALLGPVYEALGAPRPLAVPRTSLALAPGWWRRGCARWDVAPAALTPDARPPRRDPPLADELARLERALAELAGAGAALPPDQPRRVAAARVRIAREIGRLRESLARGELRRRDHPAFGALVGWRWPRRAPQDRALSTCQALWQHGPGLAAALVDAIGAAPAGDSVLLDV